MSAMHWYSASLSVHLTESIVLLRSRYETQVFYNSLALQAKIFIEHLISQTQNIKNQWQIRNRGLHFKHNCRMSQSQVVWKCVKHWECRWKCLPELK